MTHHRPRQPLFDLGDIVATPAALAATSHDYRLACLSQHLAGDWGCVCTEDRATNDAAVKDGERILSAYALNPARPCEGFGDNTLWIITECDRSATTFLLPDDY